MHSPESHGGDHKLVSANPLLQRDGDAKRPSLENRVAFQWEPKLNTLGYRHAVHRDRVVLDWAAAALTRRPAAALDVGCAYGNHILMLNARLGCDPDIELVGVDLYDEGLDFGRAFAAQVQGYGNVRFEVADLERGLPFDDDHFDLVNFADVLEHLEDPVAALSELRRVTRPGGTIVVSTPLKDSVVKRLSTRANALTRGRLYNAYYEGKETDLDESGNPVMDTHAGHDHISEMTLPELRICAQRAGLDVAEVELMSIMSGSSWFDSHPFLLSAISFAEAVHQSLRRPSWAHSACLRLVVPVG